MQKKMTVLDKFCHYVKVTLVLPVRRDPQHSLVNLILQAGALPTKKQSLQRIYKALQERH